jgi:hypothetical protein
MLIKLRDYMADITPGKLEEDTETDVLQMLMDCWEELDGSEVEKTHAYKLSRIEEISWAPPIFSFLIERHGAACEGSSRNTLHYWEVDLNAGTAKIVQESYRQQKGSLDQRMDTMAKAKDVADLIQSGKTSDVIEWRDDGRLAVVKVSVLIPETNKQTTAKRRKRFTDQLESIIKQHGWIKMKKGNLLGFTLPG